MPPPINTGGSNFIVKGILALLGVSAVAGVYAISGGSSGGQDFHEGAAASTPAANTVVVYAKSDGLIYSKDDAGVETLVSGGAATAIPVGDGTSLVEGSSDNTKELRIEVDGFTTGTVRVMTPPNADFTAAGINVAQTWTAAQQMNDDLTIEDGNMVKWSDVGLIRIATGKIYANNGSGTNANGDFYANAIGTGNSGGNVKIEGDQTNYRGSHILQFSGTADDANAAKVAGIAKRGSGDIEINGSTVGSAGGLSVAGGNTAYVRLKSITELVTIAAAATTTTSSSLLPADSFIVGVTFRVTTAIPTAATWDAGPTGGSADTYANDVAVAANTTTTSFSHATIVAPFAQNAANTIVITPNLTPADNTGRLRVTVFYYDLTAPGS